MARNAKAGTHQFPSSSAYSGSLFKDKLWLNESKFSKTDFFLKRPKHRPSVRVHHDLPRVMTFLLGLYSDFVMIALGSVYSLPSSSKYQCAML